MVWLISALREDCSRQQQQSVELRWGRTCGTYLVRSYLDMGGDYAIDATECEWLEVAPASRN